MASLSQKEVRIGLIGYKFMGKAHSNAWLNVPKFFKLDAVPVMKAICGRDEKGVRAVQKNWGWESIETSYQALLARDDIDLIDITTPNTSHFEIAMAALKAGKMVACEKPLAMTADEARKMAAEAKKRGLLNTVWFNYRRCPAIALARQIIDEGRLGQIYHVRAVYLQDWIVDPKFPLVWRLRKEIAGSGAHGDLNAHIIDLTRYLAGEFAEVVGHAETFIKERPLESSGGRLLSAKSKRGKGKVTVDDATIFLARLKNGAIATFESTRFAPGRKNHNRIEINGSKGSLLFNFERMNELEFFSLEDPPHLQGFRTILATEPVHPYISAYWPPGHLIGYEHTFVNQAADMMQAAAKGKGVKPDFEDGRRCQEVLEAVSNSTKTRCWVRV
jgi:predicted dehydrogenase